MAGDFASARTSPGLLIVPPFRDSHMHFLRDGRPVSREVLPEILRAYLQRGVFSVCDMGHQSGIGLEAKMLPDIDIVSAGYALYRTGTYGSFLGKAAAGAAAIERVVAEIAAAGADFVKVVNSGIVLTRGAGIVSEGGFSAEELRVIVAGAAAHGLRTVCHANGDGAIRRALDAGASSIEHGFFITRESLHLMAERTVSWTPTAHAFASLARYCPPDEAGHVERILDSHLSSINYAASIGVTLHAGTDSGSKGVSHGASYIEELRLFLKAGLPLEQVLAAACMEQEEIDKGNYLVVKSDFISSGIIEEIVKGGERVARS